MIVPQDLTIEEAVRRLQEVVRMLDIHIADREAGLEYRKVKPSETSDVSREISLLWLKCGAETLAAWQQAKYLLLGQFPFLADEKE